LGSVSVGWILGWYGYVPNAAQSERALFAIDLVFGYLPAVILLLTVPLLARYPLDRKTYEARIAQLQARPSPAE
jgi:Na+/melibiose symporter-like transporter